MNCEELSKRMAAYEKDVEPVIKMMETNMAMSKSPSFIINTDTGVVTFHAQPSSFGSLEEMRELIFNRHFPEFVKP